MTVVAVVDTGPLIHLADIGVLELLSLVERLVIPATVLEELEAGDRTGQIDQVEYAIGDVDLDSTDVEGLDPGETAALSLAIEREAVLLTDDLAARERATERGVEAHGSIGVIALGYARGELDRDEAASLMRALQEETCLFVTDSVIERGIELLDDR